MATETDVASIAIDAAVQHVDVAHEARDERRGGAAIDLARRADLLHLAAVHHHDRVRQHRRFFLVVGDEHEGGGELALDRFQLDLELAAELQVERAQRLVEQQDGGLQRQRPRQRHALLLAAGELADAAPLEARQADEAQEASRRGRRSPPPPCRGLRMP